MSPLPAGILASARRGANYSGLVLASSPSIYWRLGEASGTTAADASGNSRTGTYANVTLGATGLVAGDADKAGTFNGSSSVVSRAWESMQDSNTFTIEALIKRTSNTTILFCIASNEGHTSGNRGWSIRIHPTTRVIEIVDGRAGVVRFSGATVNVLNTEYHVALTSSSSGQVLYVNGVSDGTSGTQMSVPNGTARELTVGLSNGGSGGTFYHFAGTIDEFAWYPTALSAATILAHSQASGH